MKNKIKEVSVVFLAVVVLVIASAFMSSTNHKDRYLYAKIGELQLACDTLVAITKTNQDLMPSYKQVRKRFKEIEFLLAYMDPEAYLRYLNGAPLPKLEKKVPDLRIIEPKGLQVIDELIVEDRQDVRKEIKKLTLKLKQHLENFKQTASTLNLSDEYLFNAIQLQWLRIYTMNITGFDTPGTLSGLEDVLAELDGLKRFVWSTELKAIWQKNRDYLSQNQNFESFNRAEYYKLYWQPFYENLIKYMDENGIKNINERSNIPLQLNAAETHLFNHKVFNKEGFIDYYPPLDNVTVLELGKRLFFDPILSSNGKMSCATCHDPAKGFSDGLAKSLTISGEGTLDRNSPGLVNAIYTRGFFYDLRASKLSTQFEHVVFSEDEFNTSILEIINRLDSSSYYEKFKKAFPYHKQSPVNTFTFKTALSVYVSSLVGFESEFDKYMRGETEIDKSVVKGYNLFMGKANCATCHFPPSFAGLVPPYFNDSETEVLGVPRTTEYSEIDRDMGRYTKKKVKEYVDFYQHSFKTTSVRNTSLTAPYMHNGVFKDYDELMDFYNEGGGAGRGLNVPNQTLGADKLDLSKREIKDIIAFMQSLEYIPK